MSTGDLITTSAVIGNKKSLGGGGKRHFQIIAMASVNWTTTENYTAATDVRATYAERMLSTMTYTIL
jgi:hypothetical protein